VGSWGLVYPRIVLSSVGLRNDNHVDPHRILAWDQQQQLLWGRSSGWAFRAGTGPAGERLGVLCLLSVSALGKTQARRRHRPPGGRHAWLSPPTGWRKRLDIAPSRPSSCGTAAVGRLMA